MDQIELKTKTLEDLRYIAKMMGFKSIAKYKKNELVDLITGSVAAQETKAAEAKAEINDKVQADISSPVKEPDVSQSEKSELVKEKSESSPEKEEQNTDESITPLRKSHRGRPSKIQATAAKKEDISEKQVLEPNIEKPSDEAPKSQDTEKAPVKSDKPATVQDRLKHNNF
jgi:transcription termination factor Rho